MYFHQYIRAFFKIINSLSFSFTRIFSISLSICTFVHVHTHLSFLTLSLPLCLSKVSHNNRIKMIRKSNAIVLIGKCGSQLHLAQAPTRYDYNECFDSNRLYYVLTYVELQQYFLYSFVYLWIVNLHSLHTFLSPSSQVDCVGNTFSVQDGSF